MTSDSDPTEASPLLQPQPHGTSQSEASEDPESLTNAPQNAGEYQGLPEVRKQLKYILPAVSIGVFLAAADQTLVASSAGKIGSDLNALQSSSWIATAFFLTLTSIQPLYGKLSDIFGRKACLLFAYFIFSLGTLWCGLSTRMYSLIIARAVAGIGGGGMTTCVSIMMSDIVPLRERGTWQGLINIMFSAGAAVGAPLGGLLSDTVGWQWAFLGQVPLCLVAFGMVTFLLKLPHNDSSHWRKKVSRVDFLGAFTLVSAVTLLLLGLDRGSNVSWISKTTITCTALSGSLFVLFAWVETRVAAEPFAPSEIILEKSHIAAYLCNFFSSAAWFGILFYLPLYYQGVRDFNASQAGLRLIPAIFATVTGSLLSGLIMQRTGKYYILTIASYGLVCVGSTLVLLSTGLLLESTTITSIGIFLGGLGGGSGITTTLIALISNATVQDQAITTACSYLFRSLGTVMGLAMEAAIFQNMLRVSLQRTLGNGHEAEQLASRIRQSLDFVRSLDPDTQVIVRQAYQRSITGVFVTISILGVFAICASLFIREKKLGG